MKLFGFINGGNEHEGYMATVISETGDMLLEHAVQEAKDAPYHVGIGSDVHHDIYNNYAPGGFELLWKDSLDDVDLKTAYAKHLALTIPVTGA